ncbi:MAG: RHS repeat-associated core domain-containing protein [Gammaproteobacteria bacterium]
MMTPNDVSPRWVGSGWTVFNNKGKPVRQYEPFFTDTHRFELDVRIGVSPVLFYDPVERVIATLHPNHTWEKVVFDPWRQETWDVNDTVLVADPRTDPDAGDFFRRLPDADYLPTWHARRQGGAMGPQEQAVASKAAVHANTPTIAHADSLGRTFLTVAHDTFKYSDTPPADPPTEEFHSTRVVLDIEGNQREVIDVKDRVIMRYDYDMLGSRVHQASMEAGARWMLNDVAGKSLYAWDSRDHQFRAAYDQLRRPTDSFLREGPGAERVVGRSIYGESRPNPEASNLRGKVVQLFDQAGVVASDEYDFKGNLLRSQRQLAQEYKTTLDWSAAVPLEAAVFTSRTRYDALNRPTELTAPDDSIIRPAYNEANLLERMEANLRGALANGQPVWTPFVTDIDYDAKGQRTLIDYGNGVRTAYTYDPLTFRLVHLKTTRDPGLNGLASQIFEDPAIVQDLHYTYDPAGNIARIEDAVLKAITHDGEIIEPVCSYTYDALYRLIEAKGREHIGQTAFQAASPNGNFRDHPFVGAAQTNDLQALRNYTERYEYDAVGNFERLIHQAANGAWTRGYEYEEPSLIEPAKKSNRLSRTTVGQTTETYTYDGHGNMLHVPHLAEMTWDFEDQLQQVDLGGGGTAYYVYDEAGQRVRKVIERQNGTRQKERIHLGGYEVYREYGGNGDTVTLERETLHVMDDKERIALVETRTVGNDGSPAQLIRYQIGNHLGSASLELDETGQLISYEEYHPYGTTSYQAVRSGVEVSAKRYRYTGKERDEETGLYYHGARYYAGWLRRWVSCDPLSIHDSRNLYLYARANPIALLDRSGKSPDEFSEDDLSKKRAELDTEKRNYEIADKKLNSLIDQRVSAQRTFENAEKVFKKNPKLGGEAKKFIKSAKAAVKAFDEKIKQQGSEVSKLGDAVSKLEVSLEEGAEHLKELKDLEGEFNPSDKDFQKRLEGKPDVLDDDAAKKKLQDLQDQVDLEDAAKKLKEGSKKVLETPPKGGLRKLSKWVGRKLGSILPGGGAAASIMLAPEDESVIETGAHAVASEVGIGPFDLDLAWDIGTAVWEGAQRRAKWEFDETLRLEKEGKSYWEIAMRTQRGSKL